MRKTFAFISAAVLVAFGGGSFAAAAETADPARSAPGGQAATADEQSPLHAELLKKMEAINEQQRALLKQLEAVERQRQDIERLVKQVGNLDDYRGGQDAGAGNDTQTPAAVASERKAERDAQTEQVPELPRVSAEVGGVLSPRGRLVLEPSVQYIYSAVNRLSIEGFTILPALLVGLIEVAELDRDMFVGALTTRYGLTNRLELELKLPYVYRQDRTRTRRVLSESIDEESFNGNGDGIGDVEFDLRYQLPRWSPTAPYLVGNLRAKAPTGSDPFDPEYTLPSGDKLPTGSGFWSINPSLTFIYPTDPAVFFGNIGYLWTLKDHKGIIATEPELLEVGDVDPGDAIRLNVGLGLGLNDRSSFSISYSLDFFNRTTVENLGLAGEVFHNKLIGSDVTVGKLLIGYSLRLPGGTPLNLALGIGATEDAPDTELTFRIPFTVLD